MNRRWLLAPCLCLISIPALAFWQSRDSNYNQSIASGGSGSLSGTYTNVGAGPTAINLTTLTTGGTDYMSFGSDGGTGGCHKSTGGSALTFPTISGSGGSQGSDGTGHPWSWSTTDAAFLGSAGSCAATNTSIAGGFWYGGAASYGWSFTAPAGTGTQVVTVYASDQSDTLNITASLSDSSASPYTNSSCTASGSWIGCKYVLTYNAASNGQTLTVKGVTSGSGYIGIDSVTLVP